MCCGLLAGDATVSSPLDRLRERSADVRWQEIREHWLPPAEPTKPQTAPVIMVKPERTVPLHEWMTANETAPPQAIEMPTAEASIVPATENDAWSRIEPPEERHARFPGDFELTPVPTPRVSPSVPDPYDNHDLTSVASPASATLEGLSAEEIPDDASPLEVHPGTLALPEPARPTLIVAQQQPLAIPPLADDSTTIFRPITQIEPHFDYSPTGTRPYEYLCPQPGNLPDDQRMQCPELLALPHTGSTDRAFAQIQFQWMASDLTYNPLYFEDVALERYGQTHWAPLQPFVSLGKFGGQLIGLPYQMALHPVWREETPLGYYRPGEPAPHLRYPIPLNAKAMAAAAGVYTGFVFLIP